MSEYPDRYIITALIKDGDPEGYWRSQKGDKIYLYWTDEGGGWWQWSNAIGWAYRFQSMDDPKLAEALRSAPKMGPWFYRPDPSTIKVVPTPAIVKVY